MARLWDLTVGVSIAATVLVGVFSVVAATTNPGRSDATPAGGGTSAQGPSSPAGSEDDSSSGFQLRRPHDGSFGQSSGPPVAVTGGSR